MNRDTLFGGFPAYRPGADWSRIVLSDLKTKELLEFIQNVEHVSTITGVQIIASRFVPRNIAIVENSHGNAVAVIEISGE